MATYRLDRINEQMTKELSEIIRTVKDPRVSSSLVTITSSHVTPDLKFAKIFFSSIGGEDKNEIKKGLESASGYIRKQIAERLNLRITPELKFFQDNSVEYGANIEKLLKQIEDSGSGKTED